MKLDIFPGMSAVPVLGPEDVVMQKLRSFQIGGEASDRQWRDILSVLRGVGRDLDSDYLDAVSTAENLASLLLRARREAT